MSERPGLVAAVEVGGRLGFGSTEPEMIQETNNTVVWLRPHPVIAKVGTHDDSRGVLAHEHRVASALAQLDGAPAAQPLAGVETHEPTGFTVTLWRRLETVPHGPRAEAVGASLGELHRALTAADLDLPPLDDDLRRAHRALSSDRAMAALDPADRAFLRAAYEDLIACFGRCAFDERPLHGEPHGANLLHTPEGVRWIDFEGACRGPLEWDLVFLPEGSLASFDRIDDDLLDLLRTLDAARRATWAWVQARFPQMRSFGTDMLATLRERWP